MTVEVAEMSTKGLHLLCNTHYLAGALAGCGGCRWAVVVGYEDGTPFGLDCYGFPTNPTKRQLRKLKRKYR